ncbi:MAG: hypothetical protein HZB26_24955 [Candidatus Hydrogenedentes bacterium]|nr:hypothetical protein [Candidatus Hydrogenedentota bacterium]
MKHRILIAGAEHPVILRKAHSLGMDVVLVRRSHAATQSGEASAVVVADITSANELARIARAHGAHGIYASTDDAVFAAAEAAHALGLPGPDPAAMKRIHDVSATRAALASHDVACPRFGVASTLDQAREIALEIGLPAKVGAVHALAGLPTWQVDYIEDLALAFSRAIKRSPSREVIVETAIPGRRYYIEGVISASFAPAGVIGRIPFELPFDFDDGIFAPPALESSEHAELIGAARRAIDAVGLDSACVRVEIAMAPKGACVLGVCPWRPGGQIPSDLVLPAYGVDLLGNALRLAVGESPEGGTASGAGWALRWIPSGSGVVTGVEGLEQARAVPGVRAIEVFVTPGERIGHLVDATSRDRIGYVLATGDTVDRALAAANEARGLCRIVTAPTVSAAPPADKGPH